ncbi:TadE family protein [Yunchengibacter salinarum]|uniref:TadE family protein n=1 Tax=Yunchengibacter salinarum TaxID=3133399 RepID=UPI0035B5F9BC
MAVETALGLPVFLTLLAVIIELGRLGFALATLDRAAAEAGRLVSLRPAITQSALTERVASDLTLLDRSALGAVTLDGPTVMPDSGVKRFTLSLEYSYRPLLPLGLLAPEGEGLTFGLTGRASGYVVAPPGS